MSPAWTHVLVPCVVRVPPGSASSDRASSGYLAQHWDYVTSALEKAASVGEGGGAETKGGAEGSDAAEGKATRGSRRTSFAGGDSRGEKKGGQAQNKFAERRQQHYDEFARLQVGAKRHRISLEIAVPLVTRLGELTHTMVLFASQEWRNRHASDDVLEDDVAPPKDASTKGR
jgi:hypothetical protein